MDFDWKKVKYVNDQFENKPPIGRPLLLREDSYYTWIDDLISAYAELNTPEEKCEAAVNNAKSCRTNSLQSSLRMYTLTKYASDHTRPLKIRGLKGITGVLGK